VARIGHAVRNALANEASERPCSDRRWLCTVERGEVAFATLAIGVERERDRLESKRMRDNGVAGFVNCNQVACDLS
jgi:hypothetical protein